MSKKKASTGQVVISHNPMFPIFNGNTVAFSGEGAPDFGENDTAVFTAEELFNELRTYDREEFRSFIEKRAPEILARRKRRG